MMGTKIAPFTTHTIDVQWSHLHAPDDKFGADSANHNITCLLYTSDAADDSLV